MEPTDGGHLPADAPHAAEVWTRSVDGGHPYRPGYGETMRGRGGVIAPLLTGFSLATIAVLATATFKPPLADWAEASLASAVACLLLSTQTALVRLGDANPAEILTWHPKATITEQALRDARREQALAFQQQCSSWRWSERSFHLGLISFSTGLLLLIPHTWSLPRTVAVAVTGASLCGQLLWCVAGHDTLRKLVPGLARLPHPVFNDDDPREEPARLDRVGLASVLDPERRQAAGSPSEPFELSEGAVGPEDPSAQRDGLG
jgi:hypothetical protein